VTDRYRFAIAATQTHDLLQHAKLLTGAVQEIMTEGGMPHMDPAVRLICYQIAFCGNGDLTAPDYYEEVYNYCVIKAQHAANADFPQEIKNVKPPAHQAQ